MRDHGLANGGASLAVRELVARIPLGRFREDGLSGPGLSTDAEQDNGGGRHQRYRRREGRSVRRAPPRVHVVAGLSVGLVMIAPIAIAYLLPMLFIGMGRLLELWVILVSVLFVVKNIAFILWFRHLLQKEFRTRQRPMLGKLFKWFAARPS